jgi:hypothetical protein
LFGSNQPIRGAVARDEIAELEKNATEDDRFGHERRTLSDVRSATGWS